MATLKYGASFFLLLSGLAFTPNAYAQQAPTQTQYAIQNLETRLVAIEDQMRGLTGKVERFEHVLRRMDKILQRMQEDNELRFSALEKNARQSVSVPVTAPSPETNPTEEPQPTAPVTGSLGSMSIRDGQITGGTVKPKAPPLPDTPEDYGLTPQEQYDRAFSFLRKADYDTAEVAFKSFIDKNPDHKLVNNAKYWYAETFYVRSKYGAATVAFAEAYQHNETGAKAPDSLLKLAMSLGALDKKDDACGAITALNQKYPNASKTIRKRAAQESRRLGCK